MKTIREAIDYGIHQLKGSNIATPKLDSEVFLSFLTEKDRLYLLTNPSDYLDEEILKEYEEMIQLRSQGIPLAYIVNFQEFMSLGFYVDENVLIPRPDTEILVEEVITVARNIPHASILDLGSGSGAIAISLAYYLKSASVIAVDINPKAIEIGKENAQQNGVANKTTFIHRDMFHLPEMAVDILVSNPPYIPSSHIKDLQIEVSTYEPKIALDGGEDGLDFYRKIISKARTWLKSGGYIFFEIGYDQGSAVKNLLEQTGQFYEIEVIKDLSRLNRVVKARLNK